LKKPTKKQEKYSWKNCRNAIANRKIEKHNRQRFGSPIEKLNDLLGIIPATHRYTSPWDEHSFNLNL
jgi:hypothetical protein